MPQLLDRLSEKRRKRELLLRDQLLEIPRDPVPATDIEMTTAIGRTITTATKTIGATMTTTAITTIAATTTTVTTMITIGTMIIVVTIIATTITPTDGTQEITKKSTCCKTYAKNDGDHPTTIAKGQAPHGLTLHGPKNSRSNILCR